MPAMATRDDQRCDSQGRGEVRKEDERLQIEDRLYMTDEGSICGSVCTSMRLSSAVHDLPLKPGECDCRPHPQLNRPSFWRELEDSMTNSLSQNIPDEIGRSPVGVPLKRA